MLSKCFERCLLEKILYFRGSRSYVDRLHVIQKHLACLQSFPYLYLLIVIAVLSELRNCICEFQNLHINIVHHILKLFLLIKRTSITVYVSSQLIEFDLRGVNVIVQVTTFDLYSLGVFRALVHLQIKERTKQQDVSTYIYER